MKQLKRRILIKSFTTDHLDMDEHFEQNFSRSDTVHDVVIGTADGLAAPE